MTVLNVQRLLVLWCEWWSAWWSERSAIDRVEHRLSEEEEGKEETGDGEEEEEYNEEEEEDEEEDNEVLDGMENPVRFFKSNALPFSNGWVPFRTFSFRLSESATQMRFASK